MSISVFLTFLTLSGELGCMDMDADVSQHEKLLTLSGELGCMIWMQTCHCTTYGQKANSEYIHANQQRNNKRYHFEMTKETTSQQKCLRFLGCEYKSRTSLCYWNQLKPYPEKENNIFPVSTLNQDQNGILSTQLNKRDPTCP